MSNGRLIWVLCVIATVTFSCVTVAVIPMSDGQTIDHVKAQVGEYNPLFVWKMPVYSDSDFPDYTVDAALELDISDTEYRKSMYSSVFRLKSIFEESACMMIQPADPYVQQIASYLTGLTVGYSDYQRVNTALYFVQSAIEYKTDTELYGQNERWAYPLETLYAHAGDCEDVSVLFVSIMCAMGYDALLLQYDGHVAGGVAIDDYYGRTYSGYDRKYMFCECAADGCTINAGSGLSYLRWHETPGLVKAHVHLDASLVGNAYYTFRNLVYAISGI